MFGDVFCLKIKDKFILNRVGFYPRTQLWSYLKNFIYMGVRIADKNLNPRSIWGRQFEWHNLRNKWMDRCYILFWEFCNSLYKLLHNVAAINSVTDGDHLTSRKKIFKSFIISKKNSKCRTIHFLQLKSMYYMISLILNFWVKNWFESRIKKNFFNVF